MNPDSYAGFCPLALAIDPDLHTTGVALVTTSISDEEKYRVVEKKTIRVSTDFDQRQSVVKMSQAIRRALYIYRNAAVDIFVVEGQRKYPNSKVQPNDLISLGQVAGAALVCAPDGAQVFFPFPQEWKGTVPKKIHHARILGKLAVPLVANQHELDAVGLAIWGLTAARSGCASR